MRRFVSVEVTARRSLAAVMLASVWASSPGVGSKYWVRSIWRPRSMRRYRASSAWHRRHDSMCRRIGSATGSAASTASGSRTAISSHCVGMSSRLLVEQVSHSLAAPVQAHLGGRHGDTQLFCDRLMGEAIDVLEDHDRAQPGG